MSLGKFETVTLADVSINNKGEYGIGASAVDYSNELYTYLRITDINEDGTLNKNDLKSVDDEDAKNYLLNENDVVFARTGNSTGKAYYYNKLDGELVYAGFLIKFSLDPSKINPKFIKYYVLSEEYKGWVNSMCTGSTRPNINAKMYGNMELILPPREQQDFLVNILDKIDKKVEINKRINKNLTRLSSIIFNNLIEKNNEFLELEECCKFIKGKKPKEISDYPQSNYLDYLTIDVLSNQSQMYAYDEKGILVNEYDILMVMDGASSGKLFYGKSGLVGSTLAKLDVEEKYLEIVYQFLKQSEKFISDNTTGSAIPHTDKGLVLNLKCPISEELLNYSNTFKSMRSSIIRNNKEILKLQKLRDALLPKLMSGEIDVSKINCDFIYFKSLIINYFTNI